MSTPAIEASRGPDTVIQLQKTCAACKLLRQESTYSRAQLKKQGKRVCITCMAKRHLPQRVKTPPQSIPAKDHLTEEEIRRALPLLIEQLVGMGVGATAPAELSVSFFAPICKLYPPSSTNFPWWDVTDRGATTAAASLMTAFTTAMWVFVHWASFVYSLRAKVDAVHEAAAAAVHLPPALPFQPPPSITARPSSMGSRV